MTASEVTIAVTLLTSLFNMWGILYNFKLSQKLKTSDKDDEEKRALRVKIHDRLTEFEEANSEKLHFSDQLAKRLRYIANNVRRYNAELSMYLEVFVQDWRRYSLIKTFPGTAGSSYYISELNSLASHIHDSADDLLNGYSIFQVVKSKFSWIKFRIKYRNKPS